MRRQFGFWQVFAPAKVFWLIALAALIFIRLLLPRSPLPWFDEIFLASAALSMAHGGAAVPSVLGAFPHTGSVDLFYGPFGLFLGSLDVKLFGLAATTWRLLGFTGAVEAAGSQYLFVRPRITDNLVSQLDRNLDWREQLKDGQAVYLIWAKDESLPRGLAPENLRLEGSFTAQMGREPNRWRKAGWGSGYPPTNLYRIVDVQSAEKNPEK